MRENGKTEIERSKTSQRISFPYCGKKEFVWKALLVRLELCVGFRIEIGGWAKHKQGKEKKRTEIKKHEKV